MITGKILKLRGWPEGRVMGLAKAAAERMEASGLQREALLERLDAVLADPRAFLADPLFADVARECIRRTAPAEPGDDTLRAQALPYAVWGAEHIDRDALTQMENAL